MTTKDPRPSVKPNADAHDVSRLYAIRQDSTGYWYVCNTDHGSGWGRQIEQAWTRRKALKEVADMVRRGWANIDDISLVRLEPHD